MIRISARFFLCYLVLVFAASVVGCLIGGLVGGISCSIAEGDAEFGAEFGAPIGAAIGLVFYAVTHWFVFRKPLWVSALFLIGGTLMGSVPLSFLPVFGPLLPLLGGVAGYWSGVVALLVTTLGMEGEIRERESGGAEVNRG